MTVFQYLLFAAFVLFVVLPILFRFENKKIKKMIDWNNHCESAIGMRNFSK